MTRLIVVIIAGILAAPAAASATSFRVVNDRGIAQFTFFERPAVDGWFATDGFGRAEIDVEPGQVLRFTRSLGGPRKLGPPEGYKGKRYTVPNRVPDEVVITLKHTGPIYKPGLSKAEKFVIRKANEKRKARGRNPLRISKTLNSAADSMARKSVLEERWPPSFLTAYQQDFGWPDGGGGALDSHTSDPNKAIGHWTDGSVREKLLLNPDYDSIGVGEGGGWFIAQLGDCPEGRAASRCRLK